MMRANRRGGRDARLLIPVAVDLASQAADPIHDFAILC
jgi:hypothetical protein